MSHSGETRVGHLLAPAGFDDPRRLSGGNAFDREIACRLGGFGWTVVIHEVAHGWPSPGSSVAQGVADQLALVPEDGIVLVDGLLASVGATAVLTQTARLRLVVLVHMPGPPGGPPGAVLRAARRVVATSAATARELEQRHGLEAGSVLVARPGAPAADLVDGSPSGGRLLCVAAVTEVKGHDVLIEALGGLGQRDWSLVCAGDLDRDPAYVDRVGVALAQAGQTDRVRLAGPLVGADLDQAYGEADLLVLPSRQEGYGMVVTEALARGLPVVGSAVGGVAEALGRAADGRRPGVLVEPDDPTALRAVLAGWLDDAGLRARLRTAARSRRLGLPRWSDAAGRVAAAMSEAGQTCASTPTVNRAAPRAVPLI